MYGHRAVGSLGAEDAATPSLSRRLFSCITLVTIVVTRFTSSPVSQIYMYMYVVGLAPNV